MKLKQSAGSSSVATPALSLNCYSNTYFTNGIAGYDLSTHEHTHLDECMKHFDPVMTGSLYNLYPDYEIYLHYFSYAS